MVFEKVKALLAAQLDIPPNKITADTDIIADLDADSLDVVELITMLEEELDIVVTDETINGLTMVRDLVEYVESLL